MITYRSGQKELTISDFGLYPNCYLKTRLNDDILQLRSVQFFLKEIFVSNSTFSHEFNHLAFDIIKPILRPLPDMSANEFREIFDKPNVTDSYTETYIDAISSSRFELYTYLAHHDRGNALPNLLSNYFDLFGWIESDLAIDATTMDPNPYNSQTPSS